MVRIKTSKRLFSLVWVLALTGPFTLAHTRDATAGVPEIEIVRFKGNVEIRTNQSVSWTKASKGLRLNYGDVVRTGPQSIAVIRHATTTIQLYENTILEFPSRTTGMRVGDSSKDFATVFMKKGHTLIKVLKNSLQRRFEVMTPSLIAGVKGTIFKVFEEEGLKGVAVAEGIVEVVNQKDLSEVVELTQNHFTMMTDDHLTAARELHDEHIMLSEKNYFKRPQIVPNASQGNLNAHSDSRASSLEVNRDDLEGLMPDQPQNIKEDLKDVPNDSRAEIREKRMGIKDELKDEATQLSAELREERTQLKNNFKDEAKELKNKIKDQDTNLKDELREDTNALISQLPGKRKGTDKENSADEGFAQIVVGPRLHGVDGYLNIPVGGDNDHLYIRIDQSDLRQNLHAVSVRKL